MIFALGDLQKGQKGRIIEVLPGDFQSRLQELGVVIGQEVEVVLESPFGRDPFAVRVRDTLIGLRRNEARAVKVQLEEDQ